MSQPKLQLLLIDPQNDFCDLPGAALPVPGAVAGLQRVAGLIDRLGARLAGVQVTLDSHQPLHIAHPHWWQDAAGQAPAPFTQIGVDEVANGRWQTRDPAERARGLAYVQALEAGGRYRLVIWPEHCLVGGWGHGVQADVHRALNAWGRTQGRLVDFVMKGGNPHTEHYSALRAEVPDPQDAQTAVDARLIARLQQADTLLVAGEALSHCVASTLRDLLDHWPAERRQDLVLLTDCSHSVPGFEAQGEAFLAEMRAAGVRLATSTDELG
jgi:nicotinamidase-related amidase